MISKMTQEYIFFCSKNADVQKQYLTMVQNALGFGEMRQSTDLIEYIDNVKLSERIHQMIYGVTPEVEKMCEDEDYDVAEYIDQECISYSPEGMNLLCEALYKEILTKL